VVARLGEPAQGPRTARAMQGELGVGAVGQVKAAAKAGKLRTIKGLSARSEESILEGIAKVAAEPPRRLLLGQADRLINQLVAELQGTPGVTSIEPAGSFRRRRETIGDLDLL